MWTKGSVLEDGIERLFQAKMKPCEKVEVKVVFWVE